MADEKKIDHDPDNLENLSPEELQERIRQEKKNARRSLRFAFTALIAIIAVCIAWFVNNTQVRVTNINIAAENSMNFELATVGKSETIDTRKKLISDFIEKIGGVIGETYSLENDDTAGTVTSVTKSSIQWNMSEGHNNFANVTGSGQIDGTGDENIGLQPGTYGALTFYIIPKIDGEQTVNCTLHLIPYVEEAKKGSVETVSKAISFEQAGQDGQSTSRTVYEITDLRVKHILSGHIYFFMEKEKDENDKSGLYSSWLPPDENGNLHFSVTLESTTKKDTPQEVTLYWNWPTLISQVLLKDGDIYLGGRNQLFDENTQDKIVNFMCGTETTETDNSSFFFAFQNGDSQSGVKNSVKTIHTNSWNPSKGPINSEDYSKINQPYNNADQFLGKTVSYVSLELNATN